MPRRRLGFPKSRPGLLLGTPFAPGAPPHDVGGQDRSAGQDHTYVRSEFLDFVVIVGMGIVPFVEVLIANRHAGNVLRQARHGNPGVTLMFSTWPTGPP